MPVPTHTPNITLDNDVPQLAVAPPTFVEPYVQRGRKALIVLVWVTGVLGAIAVVLAAWLVASAPAATLAVFYSIIPLPIVLFIYWWIDRVEPEPFRYKVAAFVWGAVVAVVLALLFEGLLALTGISENWLIAAGAPVIEEATKGLFLIVIMMRARRVIHGVIDGIIYAGLVATGFAAVENIVYYAASYLGFDEAIPISGFEAATVTFVVRGLFSPFAHPLFTTAIGIAIGLAVLQKSRKVRWLLIFAGYVGSVALHAIWNGSIVVTGAGGFLVAYLFLAMLLVFLFILAVFLRNREQETLARSLSELAMLGWIHPAEIPHLVPFSRRQFARKFAQAHGPHAARAMKDYQRRATEAAFLQLSLADNRAPTHGRELTYGVLEHMWRLRPWLRFPPAIDRRPW